MNILTVFISENDVFANRIIKAHQSETCEQYPFTSLALVYFATVSGLRFTQLLNSMRGNVIPLMNDKTCSEQTTLYTA